MSEHITTINRDGHTTSIRSNDDDGDGNQTVTATGPGQVTGAPALTTAQVVHPGYHHGIWTVGVHSEKPFDGASFVFGLLCGMVLLYLFQLRRRRRVAQAPVRVADVNQHDVAALARRTATLERIITDPATRTASEIEALR